MPRKKEERDEARKAQEVQAARRAERGSEERLPDQGTYQCPSCTRIFEILDRSDAETAKHHLQNRGHGNYHQLIPVDRTGNA